jgi:hypothetical protein
MHVEADSENGHAWKVSLSRDGDRRGRFLFLPPF